VGTGTSTCCNKHESNNTFEISMAFTVISLHSKQQMQINCSHKYNQKAQLDDDCSPFPRKTSASNNVMEKLNILL
jgi:hypothetical protein